MKSKIFTIGMLCLAGGAGWAQEGSVDIAANTSDDWHKVFTVPDKSVLVDKSGASQLLGLQNETQRFRLYSSEKWQINLDLISRPKILLEDENNPREQASAEAFFQLSESWRVGGAISIGMNELDDINGWEEQKLQTGIRLESAFRF